MERARNIVGIIGNIISFCLFLSPVPTFYQIHEHKAVQEFQPYPYLCAVQNCLCWMFYGLPLVSKDNSLVLTINSFGLVIELIYLFIYCIYAADNKRRHVGIILVIETVFTAVMVVIAMLFIKFKNRALFVGVICDVFNVIMYALPLAIWKEVITTKNVEYMPFWLPVAGLANGICWTIYALIQFDIFILISNVLGAVFGVLQLGLYGFYYFLGKSKIKDVSFCNENAL